MDMHFGFRVGYIVIAYIVLKATLFNEHLSIVVFYGLILLYLMPFVFDYTGLTPVSKPGKVTKGVALWVSVFAVSFTLGFVLYCAMAQSGQTTDGHTVLVLDYEVSIRLIWAICGTWLFFGVADWVVYSSKMEKEFRKSLRLHERSNNSHIPFEQRVNHYTGRSMDN